MPASPPRDSSPEDDTARRHHEPRAWIVALRRLEQAPQERHGDPALFRQRFAVNAVQQVAQAAQIASVVSEEKIQHGLIQRNAARFGAAAQHFAPLCVIDSRDTRSGNPRPICAGEAVATKASVLPSARQRL
jgi:hypothetical protein